MPKRNASEPQVCATPDAKRRGGRPATGKGVQIVVRAQPDLMAAIDGFRAQEPDVPSRPEALRRLAWMAL